MKRKEVLENEQLNEVAPLVAALMGAMIGAGISRNQAQQAAQAAAADPQVQAAAGGAAGGANPPTQRDAATQIRDLERRRANNAGVGGQSSGMLRNGSRGPEVEQLQRDLGMSQVDGIFGPATERAVRTFQQNSGIQVDGIVGPETRARIAQYADAGAEEPAAGAEEPAAPNPDQADAERERAAAQAPGPNDSSGAPRPTANPNRAAGSTAPSQLRLRQQILPAIDQLLSQVTPGGR